MHEKGSIGIVEQNFDWQPQPQSSALSKGWIQSFTERMPKLEQFRQDLLEKCAVRLSDIVDHIRPIEFDRKTAKEEGWEFVGNNARHPSALLPAIVSETSVPTIAIRVEQIESLFAALDLDARIEGPAFAPYRRAEIWEENGCRLIAVERNGYGGFGMIESLPEQIRAARVHFQSLASRRREFDTIEQGLAHTEYLVDRAVADLGPHWACHLWLSAERDYWYRRCPSGAFQKKRQDKAGIGFCNIDHHTYDSSRDHFRHTIRILEKLGYELREMLYAGEMAGWGSQVLEQPAINSTIFADVDLAPDEIDIDFSHEELPPLDRHARAGTLSVLLGESILEAGLNHVAILADQKRLRSQLASAGIETMEPFSDFPFLYQELTIGDRMPIDPARVDLLERGGHIDAEHAEKLRLNGSIATHIENIERNDGYKGFNKPGIDGVLRKIDPRGLMENQEA